MCADEKEFVGCLHNNDTHIISFFGAGIILFTVHTQEILSGC